MPINLSPQKIGVKSKISISQRELLIIFSTLLAFAVSWLFPMGSVAESLFASLILLLVFPVVIIKYLLKERLENFGLGWGNPRDGLIYAGIAVIIFTALNYLLIFKLNLENKFIASPGVTFNFWYFMGYELIAATLSIFALEFFFRGFIQLGLEKRLGILSLFISALASTAVFYRAPALAVLMHFLIFLAAGILTQKSRSVIYSASAVWLIYLATDIMLLKLIIS